LEDLGSAPGKSLIAWFHWQWLGRVLKFSLVKLTENSEDEEKALNYYYLIANSTEMLQRDAEKKWL